MKKIIIASAFLLTPILSQADTGPGCGWGAMVWEGQDGLAANVMAATTNGTSGNQTFGMTTGTAGCQADKPVTSSAADDFLDSNIDKIAKDMATGQGESLETLASLLGIEGQDKSVFFSVTQSNFNKIFSKSNTTSKEVLVSLKAVMQSDNTLAKYIG